MTTLQRALEDGVDACVELMACSMLAPVRPTRSLDESDMAREHRVFCERLHEEVRLNAIGQLRRRRPVLAPQMERRGIDTSALFELDLFTSYSNERQAKQMAERFERVYLALRRLEAALTPASRAVGGRRGRPAANEVQRRADRQIAEAWATNHYRRYDELASAIGCTPRDVKLALDRHRKRRR